LCNVTSKCFVKELKIKAHRTDLALTIALLASLILSACGGGAPGDPDPAFIPTDYSIPAHWLSLPATIDKEVDVFYLYPTAWSSNNPNPQVCAIDEPSMLVQAPSAFARQATVFETVGNIFAPFYRQDNGSNIDRLNTIAGIPTIDATAAFHYFVNHYNNGRPFILLGHSQGATVLTNLLAGYMRDHPDVYRRMVAAYLIGTPITPAYLSANPHLRFAEGPDDTGVIISYNTEAPDVVPASNPVLYGMVGLVINPITWTRDETPATTAQGLGSLMPDHTLQFVPVPQYADARIDRANGVLICTSANEDLLYTLTGAARGVYHPFDIPFYYFNLRANAAGRASRFLSAH
jgi:pimeloyl-ACP methyl ester carboxylesterase